MRTANIFHTFEFAPKWKKMILARILRHFSSEMAMLYTFLIIFNYCDCVRLSFLFMHFLGEKKIAAVCNYIIKFALDNTRFTIDGNYAKKSSFWQSRIFAATLKKSFFVVCF